MKLFRLMFLLVAVALVASAAMADGIDPTVKIRKIDPPSTIGIYASNPTFSFGGSGNAGSNDFYLQNFTPGVIYQIVLTLSGFDITQNADLVFSCAADQSSGGVFNSCSSSFNSSTGVSTLDFFGVTPPGTTGILPGVPGVGNCCCNIIPGEIVNLNVSGFPTGDRYIYTGNGTASVPEPASALLLLAGCAGVFGMRKRIAKNVTA